MPEATMTTKSKHSGIRRLGQAASRSVDKTSPAFPWWLQIPVNLLKDLSERPRSHKRPESVSAQLCKALRTADVVILASVRKTMLDLLGNDRLENGGWGKRNNKTLRTFFGELPDDFDLEGSITLTRWVVDAINYSHLNHDVKERYLGERLNAYLDARFDRRVGASGRVGSPDLLGRRPIQVAVRHTATSILCYLSLDSDRFRECAKLQVKYLCDAYTGRMRDPNEVGHPDILRALCLVWLHLIDDDTQESVGKLIREGFSYFWDWLNSPTLIPKTFGSSTQLYLRLYSLCSVCDLAMLPVPSDVVSPIQNFRRMVHRDVAKFCVAASPKDHRAWGFQTMLLWSYLCVPSKEVAIDDLREMLFSIINRGGDFKDGFCVYWAVLFAIADSVVGRTDLDA